MLLSSLLIFCCKNTKLLQNVQYISCADDKISVSSALSGTAVYAVQLLSTLLTLCYVNICLAFHADFR